MELAEAYTCVTLSVTASVQANWKQSFLSFTHPRTHTLAKHCRGCPGSPVLAVELWREGSGPQAHCCWIAATRHAIYDDGKGCKEFCQTLLGLCGNIASLSVWSPLSGVHDLVKPSWPLALCVVQSIMMVVRLVPVVCSRSSGRCICLVLCSGCISAIYSQAQCGVQAAYSVRLTSWGPLPGVWGHLRLKNSCYGVVVWCGWCQLVTAEVWWHILHGVMPACDCGNSPRFEHLSVRLLPNPAQPSLVLVTVLFPPFKGSILVGMHNTVNPRSILPP